MITAAEKLPSKGQLVHSIVISLLFIGDHTDCSHRRLSMAMAEGENFCPEPSSWQHTRYKTCDGCRTPRKDASEDTDPPRPPRKRRRVVSPEADQLEVERPDLDTHLYTEMDTGLSNQRVFCSQCAKPWQSTGYKTCDNCRRKAAEQRAARAQYSYLSILYWRSC